LIADVVSCLSESIAIEFARVTAAESWIIEYVDCQKEVQVTDAKIRCDTGWTGINFKRRPQALAPANSSPNPLLVCTGELERLSPLPNSSRAQYFASNSIMANIDAHVASVLDNAYSDDEDALIASLEDSPAMDAFREQRIQQLHAELQRSKAQKNQGFGNYTEIKEEKELMDMTTSVKYAVVHFAKDDFARCATMDVHLEVSISLNS
jgi:hypothetical protein